MTPSSPWEALQSALQTLLGRTISFFLACSLGGGSGYVLCEWIRGEGIFSTKEVLLAMAVMPLGLLSLLTSYGLIVFPACLLIGFLFIRYELSFAWLLLPFSLIAWQTYIMY
jgi:hypothetical protein